MGGLRGVHYAMRWGRRALTGASSLTLRSHSDPPPIAVDTTGATPPPPDGCARKGVARPPRQALEDLAATSATVLPRLARGWGVWQA